MQFKDFNDLVGTGRPWGPKDDLPEWQLTIYRRAVAMFHRCYDPKHPSYKHYGARGIKCEFTSLSQYYNTLRRDPLWSQFKKDPDSYHVDKDMRCGPRSNYSPSTIMIVPKIDNVREAATRNHSHRVELDGVIYDTVTEASAKTGVVVSSIHYYATTPKYSHSWVDKNGVPHSAKYI